MTDREPAFYQVKMNDLLVEYKERGHSFTNHFDNIGGVGLVLDGRFYHQLVKPNRRFCLDDLERLEAFLKRNTEER